MNEAEKYTCDFYLIRHGETDYNRQQLTQGNIEVPLNALGRQQAVMAKEALAGMGLSFDYCFSSPLGRAVETGSVVSGIPAEDPRFIVIPDLHEMAFGELERTPFLEEPMMLKLNRHPEEYRPAAGGESIEEVFDRMHRVIREMIETAQQLSSDRGTLTDEKKMPGDPEAQAVPTEKRPLRILVASHGMVMRGILGVLRHTGPADVWKVVIGNCDVVHLRLKDGILTELPQTISNGDPYDPHTRLDLKSKEN